MINASQFDWADGHRVLVVDDEPDVRHTLRELLEARGYAVATAADGREALRILTSPQPPCIVVLDLMMPWMTGWELGAELRKIERLASVPIVVVSGISETHIDEMPQVVGQIPKPVDVARLYQLIERHC